ncbi:MAG: hypothetical protein GX166_01545 [Clostridiaceae bacterium]|nr:hypothetical protein [Clostridiaceae bacterium]
MGLDNNANTSKSTYSKIGCFLFVLAVNVFFQAIFRSLNLVLFESSAVQNIMQSHIFIPLSCFVSGFFSYLLTGKMAINSIASLITGFFAFLMFVEPRPAAIIWALLYYVNAFLGYGIAFFAKSYRVK